MSKEITGDAAGMSLQQAKKAVKSAGIALDADNMPEAVKQLEEAVKSLETIKKSSK